MKVSLIATVTANGQVLLAENMANVNAPQEVMGVFVQKSIEARNMVMGRSTYDMITQAPGMKEAFSGIEIVVLSGTAWESAAYKVATSPEQAIEYLRSKGCETIIIAGGTQTYNAFLDKDLVTDMYLNIIPVVIGNGGIIAPKDNHVLKFRLAEQNKIVDDIIQLHFVKA